MTYLILIYIFISFYEWFIHRYIMHGDPDILSKIPLMGIYLAKTAEDHINHHKHVNIDMTLKEHNKTTGVYFPWSTTLVFIVLLLLNIRRYISNSILISILAVCIHNILWNNWHTKFHDYKHNVSIKEGLPTIGMLPSGFIYNQLWKYHTVHHSQKGEKYNFNIIFPLFDHVFGTYNGDVCIDNMEYCKKNHSDDRCYQPQYYCFSDSDILR